MNLHNIETMAIIAFNGMSAIAIIMGGIWVLFRFIKAEKPKYLNDIETEKHNKPTFNLDTNMKIYDIDNMKILAIELEIRNAGTRIGEIIHQDVEVIPIVVCDGQITTMHNKRIECVKLYNANNDIFLYPSEVMSVGFVALDVSKGLHQIKICVNGSLGNKSNNNINGHSLWHCYKFFNVT